MLFYHLLQVDQKSFFHQLQRCNLLLLRLEDIFCYLFFVHHFQMIKEKVCLFLENKLGLTKRFNCTFCLNNSGFEVYLFQLIALWKSDFRCCNNFTETSVMKELNHRITTLPLCFCLYFSLKNILISVL